MVRTLGGGGGEKILEKTGGILFSIKGRNLRNSPPPYHGKKRKSVAIVREKEKKMHSIPEGPNLGFPSSQ